MFISVILQGSVCHSAKLCPVGQSLQYCSKVHFSWGRNCLKLVPLYQDSLRFIRGLNERQRCHFHQVEAQIFWSGSLLLNCFYKKGILSFFYFWRRAAWFILLWQTWRRFWNIWFRWFILIFGVCNRNNIILSNTVVFIILLIFVWNLILFIFKIIILIFVWSLIVFILILIHSMGFLFLGSLCSFPSFLTTFLLEKVCDHGFSVVLWHD